MITTVKLINIFSLHTVIIFCVMRAPEILENFQYSI